MSEQAEGSPDVAALREAFLAQAGAAFDLMFHPEQQASLDTFDQREGQVVDLMRGLGAWLLAKQANADPSAQPPKDHPVPCPKCGRPARRVFAPDDPLPARPLTTLTGFVTLQRAKFQCATCRVAFFPSRP